MQRAHGTGLRPGGDHHAPMAALRWCDWVHILAHLSHADVTACKLADPRVTYDLHRAETSWMLHAIDRAKLVTVLRGGGTRVFVVTPTREGYTVNGMPISRRVFVHEFPRMCMAALDGADELGSIESCLCFEPGMARTLGLPEADGATAWGGLRMRTNVGPLFARRDWPGLLQQHARFFVGWRVGPPKRQRGRRARRWTKVIP